MLMKTRAAQGRAKGLGDIFLFFFYQKQEMTRTLREKTLMHRQEERLVGGYGEGGV